MWVNIEWEGVHKHEVHLKYVCFKNITLHAGSPNTIRKELSLPAGVGDGVAFCPCPLAGCRAVELACGAVEKDASMTRSMTMDIFMNPTNHLLNLLGPPTTISHMEFVSASFTNLIDATSVHFRL